MKKTRQDKILEIIKSRPVETQEELLDALKAGGFSVTQATVSRDIRELRLSKAQNSRGKTVYAPDFQQDDTLKHYREIFK
ncbi:MAG: arginine repressor, partial [Oscillospiraceae bacterium]|nr:arginine repressor [Oscillospiraceae bacterium]